MVARSRGAKFIINAVGEELIIPRDEDYDVTIEALNDVFRWLRFPNSQEYFAALERERKKIFLRAKD